MKEVSQSEQEAVQKPSVRLPHEQATVSDWNPLKRRQRHLEDEQQEGRVPREIQDEGVEFEVWNASD